MAILGLGRMKLQLPKCKVGSKEGRTQPCMLSPRARCRPQDRHTGAAERGEGAQPRQEGVLTPADSVARVQGKRAGEHPARAQRQYP